ncbi:hypothetical protein KVT40_005470 [Elsinoe batatas]|uniref:NodB homology domain-containing protein n=1 Tax=Elsinoe batatas TaxID=2601811 RepID=A0A8K0L087_9PEZI|nr:hypothetical protein KVT40_005470 [Elsinoe batatas]
MPAKRVLVGYGVDVDAVSGWLNTRSGAPANPTNISRGIFGATVGIDRLLRLFEKYSIRATFFTPAHSLESFPKQLAKVRDAGHELGLHGYTHEHISTLSVQQQRDVPVGSIDRLTAFTGTKPRGYTAPAWSTTRKLIPTLEEMGIVYDHSFMHHDYQMYYAPDNSQTWVETDTSKDAETWMHPMGELKPSKIVEIPANWHVDDWPPLQPSPGVAGTHGFVDMHSVERLWKDQFDFAYRELIEYINAHDGVEWLA